MPLTVSMEFSAEDIMRARSSSEAWEMNKNVCAFLIQGNAYASKVDALVELVMNKPKEFSECITEEILSKYKKISGSLADNNNAQYLAILKEFRKNLARLDGRFAAMTEPKVAELRLARQDMQVVRDAINHVVKFSTNGRQAGPDRNSDQIEAAAASVEMVRQAVMANMDLQDYESMFSGKKRNRLQAAINHFARTNDLDMVQRMKDLNCPYDPQITQGGIKRDPNSRNIDYVFLIALVYREMVRKDPGFNAVKSNVFITLMNNMGRNSLPVAYTGCPGATVPDGTNPKDVPPAALTSGRLDKAMRIMCDKNDQPEDVIKVGCHVNTILAISHVINGLAEFSDADNYMYEYSRYLRSSLLDKIGVECPNFMDEDPFLLEITEGFEAVVKHHDQAAPVAQGGAIPKRPAPTAPIAGPRLLDGVMNGDGATFIHKDSAAGGVLVKKVAKQNDPTVFIVTAGVPQEVRFIKYGDKMIRFLNKDNRAMGMTFMSTADVAAMNNGYETSA